MANLNVAVAFRRVVLRRFVGAVMAYVMVMRPNRNDGSVGNIG
ncbi:MAG TPA: hypothetical protein VJQ59_08750 [Candidatus Sulfotelmatobacter sp.]|nr:hypothetical protein [Candidatus Sulfotelmatobacter sp.]